MAAQQFKAGNTRVKDFDDLWRISQSTIALNKKKLQSLIESRNIKPKLDKNWITTNMVTTWRNHQKRYTDLPEDLEDLFKAINTCLH